MPDAEIADLLARVTVLEAQARQLGRIPGELGGLSGKVRDLTNTVGGLKDHLETKVDETALPELQGSLETKVDETALRELREGLEAKVDDLSNTMLVGQNGGPDVVASQKELTGKVSRIEGQISIVMWLGPLIVAVIAVVIQALSN